MFEVIKWFFSDILGNIFILMLIFGLIAFIKEKVF